MTGRFSPTVATCGVMLSIACAGCNRSAPPLTNQAPPSQVSSTVVAASGTLGQRISKRLTREPNLNGVSINVEVSNLDGTVTLSGIVALPAQERIALKLARAEANKASVVSRLQVQSRKTLGKKKVPAPTQGRH